MRITKRVRRLLLLCGILVVAYLASFALTIKGRPNVYFIGADSRRKALESGWPTEPVLHFFSYNARRNDLAYRVYWPLYKLMIHILGPAEGHVFLRDQRVLDAMRALDENFR